jgi:hypothetical protein
MEPQKDVLSEMGISLINIPTSHPRSPTNRQQNRSAIVPASVGPLIEIAQEVFRLEAKDLFGDQTLEVKFRVRVDSEDGTGPESFELIGVGSFGRTQFQNLEARDVAADVHHHPRAPILRREKIHAARPEALYGQVTDPLAFKNIDGILGGRQRSDELVQNVPLFGFTNLVTIRVP